MADQPDPSGAMLQETLTNIFVSDARLFFPAFLLHVTLAFIRPALFLYRSRKVSSSSLELAAANAGP